MGFLSGQAAETEAVAADPPAAPPQASILIVDDNESKLLALETILAELDQEMVRAMSGREALRLLLQRDFAVILLDVNMPGMDGFETATMIRQRKRSEHTPIIFVSAISNADQDVARGYSLGAVDYIFAPFDPHTLRAKVGVFVDLYRTARELERQTERLREIERREHQRRLYDTSERLKLALRAGRMDVWEMEIASRSMLWTAARPESGTRETQSLDYVEFLRGVHPDDRERVHDAFERSIRTHEDLRVEHRKDNTSDAAAPAFLARAMGTDAAAPEPLCWMELRGRILAVERNDAPRMIGVAMDVTARKLLEQELVNHQETLQQLVDERTNQLRRSERLASIGTLAAGIAHEINNPLNAILLTAECALRYGDRFDAREAFETIRTEAERCGRITKGVLKFSKNEKTAKWPACLNEVVQHALELARVYVAAPGLHLAAELADDLPQIVMNVTEIEQVVINLVKNAAEAAGGEVNVTLRTSLAGRFARLQVRDDGPGIPQEAISHIFDPFFSTKRAAGGTGLGLSMCHGIIRGHDGVIRVESKPGEGALFTIDLPLPRGERGGGEEEGEAKEEDHGSNSAGG